MILPFKITTTEQKKTMTLYVTYESFDNGHTVKNANENSKL